MNAGRRIAQLGLWLVVGGSGVACFTSTTSGSPTRDGGVITGSSTGGSSTSGSSTGGSSTRGSSGSSTGGGSTSGSSTSGSGGNSTSGGSGSGGDASCAVSGSPAAVQVWSDDLYVPQGLSLDENGHPFWADHGAFGGAGNARLATSASAGGSPTALTGNPPDNNCCGVVLVARGGNVTMASVFGLFTVPTTGGTLAKTVPDGNLQDPTGLVYTSAGWVYSDQGGFVAGVASMMPQPFYTGTVSSLVQYGGNLYFIGGTSIVTTTVTGADQKTVATFGGTMLGLNADASGVAYYENNTRIVYRVTYAGVQTQLYVSPAGIAVTGLLTDGTNAYIAVDDLGNPGNGAILRVPETGGCAETLATGLADPQSLQATDTSVFWVNHGGSLAGSINSISK